MKTNKSSNRIRAWARLDNAAKIFPPSSQGRDTNVFRFACELTDDIDPDTLQRAADQALDRFPLYRSVLRRGLFWFYFEQSDFRPIVHIENQPPCSPLFDPNVKSLLFDISYYQNRINLEIFHSLADGTGALQFLREIVYHYIVFRYGYAPEDVSPLPYDASFSQKGEDSFSRYYTPQKTKQIKQKHIRAHQEQGSYWPESRIEIIEGTLSVSQTLAKAKSFNVSMTVYLSAVLLLAFYRTMPTKDRKKPVVLAIPVNLRNYFHSETARNFFTLMYVRYRFDDTEPTCSDILASVQSQFEKGLTKDNLLYRINQLVALEHNPLIRIVPLFIKNPVLRMANHFAQKESSATLSNIGKISMPEFCTPYIHHFNAFTSTDSTQLCLCSYQDHLMLSFSTVFSRLELEKHFFRILAADGLDIRLNTSCR